MNVIVTGGAGFIGSNLIKHLLGLGGYKIVNIDKLCFPGSIHTIADIKTHSAYKFYQVDIVDTNQVIKIVDDFCPDVIFHLAAESHVDRSIDSPTTFIESNIQGTFSMLEAFRQFYRSCSNSRKKKLRFVHVSTDEVYGSLGVDAPAFSEQHPHAPSSPYAASKAASDHLVSAWHRTYGLPVIIGNCSNNYGPYQFPEKLIPLVIDKALTKQPIPVYGRGENIRDWLHVQDHVEALCAILERGVIGERYNIGADNEWTNLALVERICDLVEETISPGYSCRELIRFVDDRPGHDLRYAIDNSRITRELAWRPEKDFDSGLEQTVRWYQENREWCTNVCAGSYDGKRLGLG